MEPQESGTDGNVGLLVLEPKSFRPFKTKDEYLYAMKEDLAEWFKCLYESIDINANNFLDILETGVLLCQHANEVMKFALEQKALGAFEMKSNFNRDVQIPQYAVQFRLDVKPGTFLARDNVSNFITWSVKMGIPEVLRFETDDLVMRKNERSVVLCLLEVARVGAKFGMLAPTIVQMEEEIDAEIAGDPPPQIKTCDVKSLDEMVRELVGRCTCPVQFPIIKVGEGKYKIGDNQTLVFVRILRKHVMIRVGGGWDTLEHYLDRHDPCRCGFQGHRQSSRAGSTTPRRASTTAISHSQPNTPRSPRKASLAGISSSAAPRPASPGFRSASPGPGSRKLPLKPGSSQPGSAVTSPSIVNKQPSFPVSGNGTTSANQRQQPNHVTQKSSAPTTPRRSASPAPRPQSPALRRSQSPAPSSSSQRRSQSPTPTQVSANRYRSPSPAPSNIKPTTSAKGPNISVTATRRCSSPVKQITLSEVRSSREYKQGQQGAVLRRTSSMDTANNDAESDTTDVTSGSTSGKSGITMDKISTMSLDEFKNLLNNALSVPNGADSQCSSDSPRSQSSVDSYRNNNMIPKKGSSANKYRSVSANRVISKGQMPSGIQKTSNIDCSSSGYSSSSVSSEKSRQTVHSTTPKPSPTKISTARPKTPSSGYGQTPSSGYGRTSTNGYSQVPSSGYGQRPTTPVNLRSASVKNSTTAKPATTLNSSPRTQTYKPKSQSTASSNENIPGYQKPPSVASRSSSQSSLKSFESLPGTAESSVSGGFRSSLRSDSYDTMDKSPITPSSVSSDSSSYRHTNGGDTPSYHRSNSYTPSAAREEKESFRVGQRANSEPRDSVSKNGSTEHSIDKSESIRVGYVSFSYEDKHSVPVDNDELSDIENEIMQATMGGLDERRLQTANDQKNVNTKSSLPRPSTPSGRPSTPSLIPRPSTPKMTRKLSVPQNNTSTEKPRETGRPPTPRKANIIARTPSANARANTASKDSSYREMFQKRSVTPTPGNRPSTPVKDTERRSRTPGPNTQYSYNNTTSFKSSSVSATRTKQSEGMEQASKDMPLSVFNGGASEDTNRSKATSGSCSGARQRTQSAGPRSLVRQKQVEPETVIMVNRSGGQHTLSVQAEANTKPSSSYNKPKVLAKARTDTPDSRSRSQTRPGSLGISRQRPQSVEPRTLVPKTSSHTTTPQSQKSPKGNEASYDRTQEWVQTAVEQTSKVQKPRVTKPFVPKVRRAMTPNSFDMRIDYDQEPRSLEEIKAALTLPINGLNTVDTNSLEAPPEDPEMYAAMEKLFHELRQQELKASVNETPGSSTTSGIVSPKQNSDCNDEETSLDSNKNIKRKSSQVSRASSNGTTPSTASRRLTTSSSYQPPPRPQTPTSSRPQTSRSSSNSSVYSRPSPSRQTPPRTASKPVTPSSTTTVRTMPPRPASTPPRPSTPTCRQNSRSSEDSVFETEKEDAPLPPKSLLSKLKEVIKVNPRKDKAEGVKQKTRIPAPKSLATAGRSRSFSNLSSVSSPIALSPENHQPQRNGWVEAPELNGLSSDSESLSNRSETPAPRLATPLTTGRSTLIRKESIGKNTSTLGRAVSVERNMSGLANNYQFYREGEYV